MLFSLVYTLMPQLNNFCIPQMWRHHYFKKKKQLSHLKISQHIIIQTSKHPSVYSYLLFKSTLKYYILSVEQLNIRLKSYILVAWKKCTLVFILKGKNKLCYIYIYIYKSIKLIPSLNDDNYLLTSLIASSLGSIEHKHVIYACWKDDTFEISLDSAHSFDKAVAWGMQLDFNKCFIRICRKEGPSCAINLLTRKNEK